MLKYLLPGICLLQIVLCDVTTTESSLFDSMYAITAPGTIRSNSKYTVVAALHKADGPCTMEISINGDSYKKSEEVILEPMSSKELTFDVPKLTSDSYSLKAKGIKGCEFSKNITLNYADKKPIILMQTDKAKYKPGDLVQFRVLFLDENTRPAKIENPINLLIIDGAQNRVKQWKNIELTKGVFSGEFQLSDQPVLGDYAVEVDVEDGVKETKTFEVAKYVLPKFEVSVDTDKDIAFDEGVMKATIRAKYTYGKPVKGRATVSVDQGYASFGQDNAQKTATKTVDVDGKGHVEFDLVKDIDLKKGGYMPPINIKVQMEEFLTGNVLNATATVNVHEYSYKLEAVEKPEHFKENETLSYTIAVKDVRGAPVIDAKNPVKLTLIGPQPYFWRAIVTTERDESAAKPLEYEAKINEQGIATFDIKIPADPLSYYQVKATYRDVEAFLSHLHKFEQKLEGSNILDIEVNTAKPQLGKPISVDIKSSEDIPYFVYVLVARGNIVKTEYVTLPEKTKSHTINFMPTFSMVPTVSMFVHYVHDKDMRFEEKVINLEEEFENSIDITANPQAKPGEDVMLNIKTDPDSFVGLLGVDQSVLLLKSGNDLSKKQTFNKMSDFNTQTPWMRGYGTYPGQKSGLVTLTNAKYPYDEGGYIQLFGVPQLASAGGGIRYAMPQAVGFSVNVKQSVFMPVNIEPMVKVREDFAESWIFDNLNHTNGDSMSLTKKIPDTITSWVVTGFSVNSKSGFALTENPTKIKVFQPFFVSTHLPYSVKRGEIIAVPVVIFNYMEKTLDAEVTMDNSEKDYEFVEVTNDVQQKMSEDVQRVKRVTVPANSGKTVNFLIHPNKVGDIPLKLKAVTPLAGDAINQMLKVEPEGVTKYGNKAVFLNLKDNIEQQGSLLAEIPDTAVPDSEYIEFVVVGDMLGPTIKNLDNLVRMPYGCGEQNMVNFVPNILVMHYLDTIKKAQPKLRERAKKYMEVGYQRELTYKHHDGSYSAFGQSDGNGSTWLTAYVVRSFHQAIPYIDVDSNVLEQGLEYLKSVQSENGSFAERGRLVDFSHQNEVTMTAFVLLAFLENKEHLEKYKPEITKGLEFLKQNAHENTDLYSLGVALLAAQKAAHPMTEKLLNIMDMKAQQENDKKWWSRKPTESDSKKMYFVSNNDVELTSYVLLALLEANKGFEETLPIVKWLVSKRNSQGGFESTQDTVMGLQAIIKFAEKASPGSGEISIDFTADGTANSTGNIAVNNDNSLLVQTHVLPKTTRKVDYLAKGKGVSMMQLAYRYNVADTDKEPSFKLDVNVKDKSNGQLKLEVCSTYAPADENSKESNMVVQEVALPSGYTVEKEELENLINKMPTVKRVETKNADSKAVIYFQSLMANEQICLDIFATRTHDVAKQKPAAVTIYDYYDTARRATAYYEVESAVSDICTAETC